MGIIKRYIPVVIILLVIAFLTMQSPKGTMFLSDRMMNFCKTIVPGAQGRWAMDRHWFRTLLHIPLYFALGCVVSFAVSRNGRRVAICSIVAIVDEVVKILLPTREFGAVDLVFDAIGFMLGISVVTAIRWLWDIRE